MIRIILVVLFICLFSINSAFSMEIAITVDDIPANGNLPIGMSRMDITKKMLSVFKKHNIEGIYGLMNGGQLNKEENIAIFHEWTRAGHFLGNHTYHHLDLAKIDSNEYMNDIKRNEQLLVQFMPTKDYHYFRYPFLSEGNTQEKRDTVRQFLFNNHYKIAPVTVDFFEYEWNDPYVRCLNKNDKNAIQWLKESYIEQANNALIISHELSTMLYKRDIKNVLLIHMNAMTAEMLDALLTTYEKQGVKFISLNNALNDEIYQINPNIVRDRAYTFLNQIRLSRGLQNPNIVQKLYASLPEDKLNQLCK